MRIFKWGNGLAVRLPASVVSALQLKEGEDIEIQVKGERAFAVSRSPTPAKLLASLRKLRGRLPADFKFERPDANKR